MSRRAVTLSLLCLCLAWLANGYPVETDVVLPQDEPLVPVKEGDKVQEQSAPVEQPSSSSSDEVHEPVYPDKELPAQVEPQVAPQERPSSSSSEEETAEEVKSEEVSPQEVGVLDSKEEEVAAGPEATFSQYDEDKDGYIDIFEWERKIEDELAKKKFLDADVNDDDKISQEEYQVWSSPAAPQENVNEVYVPSVVVSQPVDEQEQPLLVPPSVVAGRSAEESGVDPLEKVVIVSAAELEPQASDESGQIAPVAASSDESVPKVVPVDTLVVVDGQKDLIPARQPQDDQEIAADAVVPLEPQPIAVVEESSQPAIVLLEDKKPEAPVVEEAKPSVKSVDLVVPEVVKAEEELKKDPLPVAEDSASVESQEKPKEEVKVDPQPQPQPESVGVKSDVLAPQEPAASVKPEVPQPDASVQPEVPQPASSVQPEVPQPTAVVQPEVSQPAVPVQPEVAIEEKKAEVASEEKKPEVAVVEKVAEQPEVVVSEQPKLQEEPTKKPEVVVSESPELPETPVKKAEVSKGEEKPSNAISS